MPPLSRTRSFALAVPGVALAAAIAAGAFLVSRTFIQIPLNPIMLAVIFGAIFSAVSGTPTWISQGLEVLPRFTLRFAIVLLGFQISLTDILNIGSTGLIAAFAATATTLLVTIAAGRALGLARNLTLLIAAGTSICGVAAIIAMGAAIRANGRDMTYAILCVTLFGLFSMLLFPLAAPFLELDARLYGIWTGAAVHEVAQVVAAGFQHSTAAGEIATVTKLSRVVLLAPVVAIVALLSHREDIQRSASILPWFVTGFLIAVAVNSIWPLPGEIRSFIAIVTSVLFTFALAAIGLTMSPKQLISGRGKELVLGLIATLWIAGIALAVTLLLG